MATKTLKLKIISDIQGQDALDLYEKSLKDIGVEVGKFTTTSKIASDGTTVFAHAIDVKTRSIKEQNAAIKESNRLQKEGTARTATTVIQDPERERREREKAELEELRRRATLTNELDRARLAKARDIIKLKTLEEVKGINHIDTLRESQRQKEIAREQTLQRKLAQIREQFAKGNISFIKQGALRNKEVEAYERSIIRIKNKTAELEAIDRNRTRINKLITQAHEKQARAINKVHSGTSSVVRAHRAWTIRIAEGIGLYRTVSFLLSKISQSILAIPRIGIERQTTEAVFESTLGGGAGSAAAFTALSLEADRAGISITTLRETFRNLNASMSLAGENTETVWKVFSNINTVSTALHLSADKTSSIFLALAQIFNKTKVQSEELVKQLGNLLPGAFASFQKANENMFKSTQDLIKQMSLGTVFAHQTVENFTQFLADRFSAAFAVASTGLQANLQRLDTAFVELGEAIFSVTKGPMIDMVKGLTSIVNGLKGAIEGTNAFSVVLEQLGTVAIVAFTLKAFKMIASLGTIIGKAEVAATRLTAVAKVPIGIWAVVAAKALGKLKVAFAALGGWPAVIIAGVVELIGYLTNLGQEARDAAERIDEIWEAREELRKKIAGKPISIDIEIGKAEGVVEAKGLLDSLSKEHQNLIDKRNALKKLGLHLVLGPSDKDIRAAREKFVKAARHFAEITKSTTDEVIKKRREDEAAAKARQDNIDRVKFKKALSAQKVTLGLADEETRQKLDRLETAHGLELISDENFYKQKEALLLRSVSSRIRVAKQNIALVDTGENLEQQLELKKLESEKARIAQSIALERNREAKKASKESSKAEAKERAKQEALRQTEVILLRLQGREREAEEKAIENEIKLAKEKYNTGSQTDKALVSQTKEIAKYKRINLDILVLEKRKEKAAKTYAIRLQEIDRVAKQTNISDAEVLRAKAEIKQEFIFAQEAVIAKLEEELAKNSENVILQDKLLEQKRALAEIVRPPEQITPQETFVGTGFQGDTLRQGGELSRALAEKDKIAEIKQQQLDANKYFYDQDIINLKQMSVERARIEKQAAEATLRTNLSAAGGAASIGENTFMALTKTMQAYYGAESKEAKAAFIAYKAFAIARAVIGTAQGVVSALSIPYVGIALAAVIAAAGAVQIAKIASEPMPAAHGGLTNVPKEQTYLLDKGERVLSPRQNQDLTNYISNNTVNNNNSGGDIKIINSIDPSVMDEYINSSEGERTILNVIQRNREVIA